MSSTIDPAKLKVADLRNELSARGLDVKGTKPILVKRLKDALEKELDKDLPDTSIADTSTEDLDTSTSEETSKPRKSLRSSVDEREEIKSTKSIAPQTPENSKPVGEQPQEKPAPQPVKASEKSDDKKTEINPSPTKETEVKSPVKPKTEAKSPEKPKTEAKSPVKIKADLPNKPEVKTDSPVDEDESEKAAELPAKEMKLEVENGDQADHQDQTMVTQEEADKDPKSEDPEREKKRKRTGDSPERQPKRPRSPIREDEPEINAETIQLSWFDSDLNLLVDKTNFLSAKPLTEGAFGYIWAGARATHGVSTGKVCYEVKITEKLRWEEFYYRDNRFKTDYRRSRQDDRRGSRNYDRRDDEKSRDRSERSRHESDKSKDDNEKSSAKGDNEKPEDDNEKPKDDNEEKDGTEKPTEVEMTENSDKKDENEPESMQVTTNNKEDENDKSEEGAKPDESMETGENDERKSENGDKKCDGDEEKSTTEEKDEQATPLPTHFFRIGWSVASASLQLGEDKNSYGYESTGKIAKNNELSDYGITFDAGDVVSAYLDVSETTVTIQFTVNGQVQPSIEIPMEELPEGFVLFPHILTRNYSFEVNFGEKEEPWFAIPSELSGYEFISKVENKVIGHTRPENRSDCEVILMCGLPASGKTHWVQEYVASNSEKNYTLLSNTSLLERMTISGEPLKSKYKGKWGSIIDRLQKCINKLVSMAALRRRNYIIDQTNVFPSAQRRKLRPFEGFKRKAVIVVVADEEQARRQSLQETQEGKEVPDSTILEMKAAMVLPTTCDWLEEVTYVGAEESEAKEIVSKYNAAGKAAGYGSERRFSRDNRWNYRRNDYRGGRNYRDGGYDRYHPYQSRDRWGPPSRHGGSRGGWKQDQRSRDWQGGGYSRDRDYYNQGGYRNQQSGGGGGGNRSGGQRWGGGGWGGQSGWNQQSYNRNYNQGWGGQNQGGWGGKYGSSGSGGGGQNYGGYSGGWNYYGQQGQQQQNWSGQGQQQSQQQSQQQAGYSANTAQNQGQYAQAYSTQEAWAQYAKQYAQHQQMAQTQAAAAAAVQKR